MLIFTLTCAVMQAAEQIVVLEQGRVKVMGTGLSALHAWDVLYCKGLTVSWLAYRKSATTKSSCAGMVCMQTLCPPSPCLSPPVSDGIFICSSTFHVTEHESLCNPEACVSAHAGTMASV